MQICKISASQASWLWLGQLERSVDTVDSVQDKHATDPQQSPFLRNPTLAGQKPLQSSNARRAAGVGCSEDLAVLEG